MSLRSAGRGGVFGEAGDPRFSLAGQRRPIFANASLGRFCAARDTTRMDAARAEEVVSGLGPVDQGLPPLRTEECGTRPS